MTDREKIEAALDTWRRNWLADNASWPSLRQEAAEVERLIRDAASRAWVESRDKVIEYMATDGLSERLPELPADFPLVVAPANGEKERGK